jgi:hypothetical protein
MSFENDITEIKKSVDSKVNEKITIEFVQIGLDNAGKIKTKDTKETLEDGDTAYKVDGIYEDPVYFKSKDAAKQEQEDNE